MNDKITSFKDIDLDSDSQFPEDKSQDNQANENKGVNGRGRPKKPKSEVIFKHIQVAFTKEEYELIKDKAGLVKEGPFVKHIIAEQTDLLK